MKFIPILFPFLHYSFLFFLSSRPFITLTNKHPKMNKFSASIQSLTSLIAFSLIFYLLHQLILDSYFSHLYVPLLSIYLFNFFSVLILLIIFRINIDQQYFRPIVVFISLTLIKMLFVVIYFILMINYNSLEATDLVYSFFPVYFIFLAFEVISLKKWLNNL